VQDRGGKGLAAGAGRLTGRQAALSWQPRPDWRAGSQSSVTFRPVVHLRSDVYGDTSAATWACHSVGGGLGCCEGSAQVELQRGRGRESDDSGSGFAARDMHKSCRGKGRRREEGGGRKGGRHCRHRPRVARHARAEQPSHCGLPAHTHSQARMPPTCCAVVSRLFTNQ
jgi:hypothetical protein